MLKFKTVHCNEDPAAAHALETIADLLGIPRKEFVKAVNVPPELLEMVLTAERNDDNMEMKKPADQSTYGTGDEIHTKVMNTIVRNTLKTELNTVISDIKFYENKNTTKDIRFYKQAIKNINTILSKYPTQLEKSKELLLSFQKLFLKGLEREVDKESGKDLFDNFHIQLESLSSMYKGKVL